LQERLARKGMLEYDRLVGFNIWILGILAQCGMPDYWDGGLESLFRVSYFPPPNVLLFDEGGRVG
jgi:hypothetical protein